LQKPRSVKTINGITVGPNVELRGGPCDGTPGPGDGQVDLDSTRGSDLQIEPKYLPAGTLFDFGNAGTCDGVLTTVEKSYSVPGNPSTDRFGGRLIIFRFRGDPAFPLSDADERVSAGMVAGRPAVVARPVTDSGFGGSAIVIREADGLTVIRANGLTLSELLKIAEGLY
jgi:hypothetical protein